MTQSTTENTSGLATFMELYTRATGNQLSEAHQKNLMEVFGCVSEDLGTETAAVALFTYCYREEVMDEVLDDVDRMEKICFDHAGDYQDVKEYLKPYAAFVQGVSEDSEALNNVDWKEYQESLESGGFAFCKEYDSDTIHVFTP